ncbi:MAG: aromatic ring-hydroxylating dioxygenase subunit alpha [Kangiellaceae bacterium]|nr:aromatic ring-hydroxylating dioxygenase subunit alpha [Kangiellaceae bacterium]MCW9015393.1 aromatic ring-hydroxylating dioxygenase subunit alpha [Kangiellaceae bacterium]
MSHALFDEYKKIASQSIHSAVALPFSVYSERSVLELESKKIFNNDWIFVCAEGQLSDPGSYFAMDLAGEAIAVIRTSKGELIALSNICRHRGTPLLDKGFGLIQKNITCPYHAWTYSDEGDLKAIPFQGEVEIDKKQHCLPKFHIGCWLGLVFVNLGEQPQPIEERFAHLSDYLSNFQPERFIHANSGDTEVWQANWKLAVENAIESYHLFKVHKETLETVTPSKNAYYVAGSSEWAIAGGKMKTNESKIMQWLTGETPEVYKHYLLVFLPPNFIGIMTYESFDWISILPIDETSCRIYSGGLSESSAEEDKHTKGFVQQFMAEDKVICERVQQGMKSTKTTGGKLVEMEKILVDFRQFLASRLFDVEPSPSVESKQASLFYEPPDG